MAQASQESVDPSAPFEDYPHYGSAEASRVEPFPSSESMATVVAISADAVGSPSGPRPDLLRALVQQDLLKLSWRPRKRY